MKVKDLLYQQKEDGETWGKNRRVERMVEVMIGEEEEEHSTATMMEHQGGPEGTATNEKTKTRCS